MEALDSLDGPNPFHEESLDPPPTPPAHDPAPTVERKSVEEDRNKWDKDAIQVSFHCL